jgi:hypothetical protein
MSEPKPARDELASLVRKGGSGVEQIIRRQHALAKRKLARVMKALALMVASTLIIVPAMIASGLLLGPSGVEGIFLAPLAVITVWIAILYWMFGRKTASKAIAKAKLPQLPPQAEIWLDEQRRYLPSAAQGQLDSLTLRLQSLTPQLETLVPDAPGARELRHLLAEELPELVRHYRKVPDRLAREPLYGGKTPEHQLVDGLATLDEQLASLQEQLAKEHMHALATHQRYLELKYKLKDED